MLNPRSTAVFASSIFLVTLVASSASGAAKPWAPIVLKRVAVGVSNIVPGPGGRGAIAIPISSNSEGAVSVVLALRPPAPGPECTARMTLEAHRDSILRCPQDDFVADADYVISVAVFDSSGSDTLESGSSSTRLAKKDVKTLHEWLEASTLPKTFKHVEKVDKVTTGTSLTSMFGAPKGDGTLTADSTGVTYKTKKETIVIAAAALRDVQVTSDPQQPWVVVTYEEAGQKKSVSFKPNVYSGDASAPQIATAIQAVLFRQ